MLPDSEAWFVANLTLTVPVRTRWSGTGDQVTVRRDGGAADRWGIVDRPRMSFQIWHPTAVGSYGIVAELRAALRSLEGVEADGAVLLTWAETSVTPLPERDSTAPAWMLTGDAALRSTA